MFKETKNKIPFVLITQDWLDRWLPVLKETELKAYLRLAYHYNLKNKLSFPGQQTIAAAIGVKSHRPVASALARLEDLALIEALKKSPQKGMKGWPSNQYRMLHVDENGYHRAERQQSSLKDAISEKRAFLEFATSLPFKYNSHEERLGVAFEKYPEFKVAYYATGSDKDEDFDLTIALIGFFTFRFREKYSDLAQFDSQLRRLTSEAFSRLSEHEQMVKENLLAEWERAKKDYAYCGDYIANHYPKYFEALKVISIAKGKNSEEYKHKYHELVEKHPEVKEISHYCNYGIFRELAEKHGISSRLVINIVEEISLNTKCEIGFKFDHENYVHKVVLPNETVFLTDEEKRLVLLEFEHDDYRDPDTGESCVLSEGFTPAERRDFKGTLEKIRAAKLKALDILVENVTGALADARVQGLVRENAGGEYRPDFRFRRFKEDGSHTCKSEPGYHPPKMDLKDLLRHITHEINQHTEHMREYDCLRESELPKYRETEPSERMGKPRENALVPIPPVTLEQVRTKFEENKVELQARKWGNKEVV